MRIFYFSTVRLRLYKGSYTITRELGNRDYIY